MVPLAGGKAAFAISDTSILARVKDKLYKANNLAAHTLAAMPIAPLPQLHMEYHRDNICGSVPGVFFGDFLKDNIIPFFHSGGW